MSFFQWVNYCGVGFYFYHDHYVFVPTLVIEREAAGLVRVCFVISFIDLLIYVACPFYSECCIVGSGAWSCGGFGGA